MPVYLFSIPGIGDGNYGGIENMSKERKTINETNLLKGLLLCPATTYDLAKNLGAAMDANKAYERIPTRPEHIQIAQSKLGIFESKTNVVVGILNTMQKKTGKQIIKSFAGTKEEKRELIFDLDDFFNELYANKFSE